MLLLLFAPQLTPLELLAADAIANKDWSAGIDWPPPPSAAQPPEAESLQKLQAGQVIVNEQFSDLPGGGARAQMLVRAEAAGVWRVLGDCASNHFFVRGLRDCEILYEDATSALTRQVSKYYSLAPRLEYTFATRREPHSWIQIRLVKGDFKALEGSWRFDPLPDGWLLVTHEVRVQTEWPVPRWWVRRALLRDLPKAMSCLRGLAGGSPDPGRASADRADCRAADG